MSDKEQLEYSKIIKEGISKCTVYLKDKFDLVEKASLTLRVFFPVDDMLLFCMNENRLRDLTQDERKSFMKNVFVIYFNYSKNLLSNFDIYAEKSITEETSQIVNYLSKVPKFSEHLATIGYIYQQNVREWIYSESFLTKDRRVILEFITICCCLGCDYLEEPTKLLGLTIFEKRRRSLIDFMKGRTCEYCNFEINEKEFCCSVCCEGIEKMDFFTQWENDFNVKNNNFVDDNVKENGNEKENLMCIETWECLSCTFRNEMNCATCAACLNPRLEDKTFDSKRQGSEPTDEKREYSSMPVDTGNTWQCDDCTFINQKANSTCNVCHKENGFANEHFNSNEPSNNPTMQQSTQMEGGDSRNYEIERDFWKCKGCGNKNRDNGNCKCCGVTCDEGTFDTVNGKEISRVLGKSLPNVSYSETWECLSCTFRNEMNCATCAACLNPRLEDKTFDSNRQGSEPTDEKREYSSMPAEIGNTWQCDDCTFINQKANSTCNVCHKENGFANEHFNSNEPSNNPTMQQSTQMEGGDSRNYDIQRDYWQCKKCGNMNRDNGNCKCSCSRNEYGTFEYNDNDTIHNEYAVKIPMLDQEIRENESIVSNIYDHARSFFQCCWRSLKGLPQMIISRFHSLPR